LQGSGGDGGGGRAEPGRLRAAPRGGGGGRTADPGHDGGRAQRPRALPEAAVHLSRRLERGCARRHELHPGATVPRVCVIGSANVDYTVGLLRLPNPGETVSGGTLLVNLGGKGANQAVAARRLRGEVRVVGCVGGGPD